MVTRYGQADIPREVSDRRVDHRSAQAADFPSIPFIQYVHIRCCIKNNCANCTLKWEIQWFDGELFIDTCMTSPAKRADVACLVKPEGRRPDPLFNIPKDYNWPRKARIWIWIYSIYLVIKKIASESPVYIVDWRPAFAVTSQCLGIPLSSARVSPLFIWTVRILRSAR